ncbi:glycine oxidase ThiO [Nocardia stercoris]|uniref:glycine oxidase n=1 Tax=Nocardia stercoris TaxID=2483361 RepID=A0A3M2LAL2_9NOCA|nr:glycine oxidase ThiO [Nocardia stercoris]
MAVVGGGVIGLAVAWRAAAQGWTVTLHDPAVASGASWVAGGMLAPLSEGWPGEEAVFDFGAASLARWPGFAADLRTATGVDVFTADATLTVALDAADAADLRTVADFAATASTLWTAGDNFTEPESMRLLNRAEVRAAEPGLARTIRAGLLSPREPAVDNRLLVGALRQAAEQAGVRFVAAAVDDLASLESDRIVLAAGAASARLWPGLPVRPVKGEILRLRQRPGALPPPRHVVRARVHGRSVYLVPRADGMVVGATQYEAGFDTEVTVAGVRDLIADAEAVFPALGEYEFAEVSAAGRPVTPDNLPLLGPLDDRVLAATGNGRNGILGVPLSVDAVLSALAGSTLDDAKAADPHRFPGVAAALPGETFTPAAPGGQ